MALPRPRGIERIKRPDPFDDDVRVVDGGMDFEIPEQRYRERGYEPPSKSFPGDRLRLEGESGGRASIAASRV